MGHGEKNEDLLKFGSSRSAFWAMSGHRESEVDKTLKFFEYLNINTLYPVMPFIGHACMT